MSRKSRIQEALDVIQTKPNERPLVILKAYSYVFTSGNSSMLAPQHKQVLLELLDREIIDSSGNVDIERYEAYKEL